MNVEKSWVLAGLLVLLSGIVGCAAAEDASGDTQANEPTGDGGITLTPDVESDGASEEVSVPIPDGSSPEPDLVPDATSPPDDPFSFFVTSIEGMRELSGSMDGFGGDLGGLEGADEICRLLASNVDAGHKTWRAFLSATVGPDGGPVHAIERIGEGPWYDRNARLVAASVADLLHERPIGDPQVVDDLPNEYGQGQKQYGDNHDVLTGTNAQGMLNDPDPISTCQDWTSSVGPGSEKKVMGGHSWPREQGAGPGGGGDTGGATGPPPWFNACNGLGEGEPCEVTKGKHKFEGGTCSPHPDDGSVLICLPPDGEIPSPPGGGGGGGGNDGKAWMDAHTVPGCAPGVQLEQVGGGEGTDTVGGAGGYGAIYCFALEP